MYKEPEKAKVSIEVSKISQNECHLTIKNPAKMGFRMDDPHF
jgi:hypothetical protein